MSPRRWRRSSRLWEPDFERRAALDYGCGVGRLTLPLAERCEHVYGVDVSPSMLREAARNAARMGLPNVEWVPPSGSAS